MGILIICISFLSVIMIGSGYSRIRLKNKGIVSMKNPSVRGDQYVTVQISVPQNLSAEAKQKLREYEAACAGRARTA